MSGVYMIHRSSDGQCYVGSASDVSRRWRSHCVALDAGKHHARYLQRSWVKHGADMHEFVLLESCEKHRETLLAREQFFMDILDPRFNTSRVAGSRLGVPQPRSAVESVAASNRGRKHSPEVVVRMSAWQKGRPKLSSRRPCSEAQREAIRVALTGRTFTDETRRKMSESAKERRASSETKLKLSVAHLGKHPTGETRARLSAALVGNTRSLGAKRSHETRVRMAAAQWLAWIARHAIRKAG